MSRQKGGGSVGQSLRYVDPSAPEQTAGAGSNLLIERGLIARPAIGGSKVTTGPRGGGSCETRKRKGGFYPSIMSGVVNAGMISAPLATFAARKLFTRKRRGGGKKGERWQAQREEAKAELLTYGKPTAINIQRYAIAKRKGPEDAEEYLEQYRKRKQEKEEAKQAEKAVKKAKQQAKKAEREAKKASRNATKKKRAPKAKAKSAKGKHIFFNNEGHEVSRNALNSLAKKVNVPKPASPKPAQAKTRKSPSEGQKKYFEGLKKAKEYLSTVGAPRGPNMSKYASMVMKGENTSAWLENFQSRRPLSMATKKAKKVAKPKTPEEAPSSPRTPKMNRPRTPEEEKPKSPPKVTAVKTRKSPSEGQKKYFEGLKKAKEYLSSVGAPTGPNMSKYASMVMKGENTSAWLENFKTRRPLSMASTKKVRKPKAKPAPKPLTAVKEENENEMQGYSENFNSEN